MKKKSRLQLLYLMFLVGLVSGQNEFSFSASRQNSTNLINLFNFSCEDVSGPVSGAMYFRNSEEIPSLVGSRVLYVVNRTSEGDFACGRRIQFSTTTSNSRTLIARPVASVTPVNRGPFIGEAGSTVRLDCSITPGVVIDQYFVTWRNASDPAWIFYQIFPPIFNMQPSNRDSQRYSLDPRNFSLFIHGVTPVDAASDYVCELGVEDPSDRRIFRYERTQGVNLTLFVTERPRFLQTAQDVVVVSGDSAIFSCETISSPSFTIIHWLHGGRLIAPGGRYNISTEGSRMETRGAISVSTLTIRGLTGFDSGIIECRVTFTNSDNSRVITNISSQAGLSVLDEVDNFNPRPLESGGFLYEIGLRAPLLVPLRLMLVYYKLDGDQEMVFRSEVAYFNSSKINHVASRGRVPFNAFRVKIALTHGELTGPYFQQDNHYRRAGLSDMDISLTTLVVLLTVVLVCVVLILLFLCCSWFKIDKNMRPLYESIIDAKWKDFCRSCMCCMKKRVGVERGEVGVAPTLRGGGAGEDNGNRLSADSATISNKNNMVPSVSKNGFTKKMAEKYVKALKETILFAQKDSVISVVLNQTIPKIEFATPDCSPSVGKEPF